MSDSCGKLGCYVCWDGDCLSESAYWRLRGVEIMLTEALDKAEIDWDKIEKVNYLPVVQWQSSS